MKRLYAGGWIVVCDDAGTEHPSGWLLPQGDCDRRTTADQCDTVLLHRSAMRGFIEGISGE